MTLKQRVVAQEMVDNGGSMANAMRKAHYSPAMVKNPQKVAQSKGFNESLEQLLVEHGITLETALEPIEKALHAKKVVHIEGDFYVTEVDDLDMQLKASDRAIKLLGMQSGQTVTNNFIQVVEQQKAKYGF